MNLLEAAVHIHDMDLSTQHYHITCDDTEEFIIFEGDIFCDKPTLTIAQRVIDDDDNIIEAQHRVNPHRRMTTTIQCKHCKYYTIAGRLYCQNCDKLLPSTTDDAIEQLSRQEQRYRQQLNDSTTMFNMKDLYKHSQHPQ